MSDLISREDAIEALKRAEALAFAFGYHNVIGTIRELPAIDPAKWITVSEAMPEEADGTVLVCMPNKFPYNEKEPFVNAKHNRQVETATYSQYSDTWHFKNGGVTSVRPIAWMPLPMPWKGEE